MFFYERTALSKDKAAMLVKGSVAKPEDVVTPNEAIKDPYVLEFLDLKDEYSESDLEAALIQRLEDFLLELGEGFTFVGRQRRLRIDQTWYRVDLLGFYPEITDGCERVDNLRSCLATLRRILGLWNRSMYSNTSALAASSVG